MSCIYKWCRCSLILLFLMLPFKIFAAEEVPPPPQAITEDAQRMLELGQLLMGENNPAFAPAPNKLSPDARNKAGKQATQLFTQLSVLYPDFPDGWLWLGIACTNTLHYQKNGVIDKTPHSPEELATALRAFRNALDLVPQNLLYATYYGDALMSYLQDFDAAYNFWQQYLTAAESDLQRVTALVQMSRALLNKAYFAFQNKKIPIAEINKIFASAENYAAEAAEIMPRASDVIAIQELLKEYHPTLAKH